MKIRYSTTVAMLFSVLMAGGQCVTTYPSIHDLEAFTPGQPGTLLDGWTNASGDSIDWWVDEGGTPSNQTGPTSDHTTGSASGNYLYIEASSPNNPNKLAVLNSPCFDVSSLAAPHIIFWYHMYSGGNTAGSLHMDVDNGTTVVQDVWFIAGNQGNQWHQVMVDLSSFGPQVSLTFRGITGTTWQSDIAVDDLQLLEFIPVYGCTDPVANNYDPNANIEDGSCDYSCPAGQVRVEADITSDQYPNEISWDLKLADGTTLASGTTNDLSMCVDTGACVIFSMHDSYGDGIFSPGGYTLTYDGQLVVQRVGYNYGFGEFWDMGCPPGTSCGTAIIATTGTYTATSLETWYDFTPAATGSYSISTCGTNTCDTRIWVYDFNCQQIVLANNLEGTTFADDNDGGCGLQAVVTGNMEAGVLYHVRIGDNAGACNDTVNFEIIYNGPVEGCMDPGSCNFEPLATVGCVGCCLYPGDPACPDGPDLEINSAALTSSIYLSTVNITDVCAPEEGCTKGLGQRYVLRFSTRIDNIGNTDYYIGNNANNPQMFDSNNCHGHNHYAGYADYLLFDPAGNAIPVGFKNGFCVIDVGCFAGTGQYGCSNMGISAGCYDVYGAGTTCNWIDITDVPAGIYTLIVRTNWDHVPDALGRHEVDYSNNYGQVCLEITRDASNVPSFSQLSSCAPWTDCAGQPYGDSRFDCTGVCGGNVKTGDRNADTFQDQADAMQYVTEILGDDATVSSCTDLNNDGEITVTDAALMANCYNQQDSHDQQPHGVHYHPWCDFPRGFYNSLDSAYLSIGNFNPVDQYVDIYIMNPTCEILGYEFELSGLTIQSVTNLAEPNEFPIVPQSSLGGTRVIGMSYVDSTMIRHYSPVPLCRVNYFSLTGSQICISSVVDVVNDQANNVYTSVTSSCVTVNDVVAIKPRAFLEGPFSGTYMSDALRDSTMIPTTEPYTALGFTHVGNGGSEWIAPTVLDVSGNDAIVDWMMIELRDPITPTTILQTRSVLIQRDGDVVGLDGSSTVIMPGMPGNYHVALRHRNHLGVMTAQPIALSAAATTLDLTLSTTPTYGSEACKDIGGIMVMWAGNTFNDGKVKYTGPDNDRDPILTVIGGNVPTAVMQGYHREDVDMDGVVKYTGVNNDRDPILVNIGGSIPTAVRSEQLP